MQGVHQGDGDHGAFGQNMDLSPERGGVENVTWNNKKMFISWILRNNKPETIRHLVRTVGIGSTTQKHEICNTIERLAVFVETVRATHF